MTAYAEPTRTAPPQRVLRSIGGAALIAMGAVHLDEYIGDHYSVVTTIGPLFLLNFIGGVLVGLGLMAPLERLPGRLGRIALILLALAGIAMALSSIVFLLISEHAPLFGFREFGYRLSIVLALVTEGIAVMSLAASFASRK